MRSVTARMPSESSSPPVSRRDPGFALYVHWPFCLSKCPYCDFNSHVREAVDHARWRNALIAEIDHFARLAPGRRLTSIFFGGGTPSLMEPETAAAAIARAESRWRFADDIEITLEANPSSVERGRFAAFRAAGVNRVSIGVQSFDDRALRFLGRAHDSRDAIQAIETARAIFPRVSFDLIYARPGQSADTWREELDRALGFGTEHLSLYQLTIEPGTAFATAARLGNLEPLGDDEAGDLYDLTREALSAAGLDAYEISNHARSGAESRHNLTYWRYGDYAGVGPGAHGRLRIGDGADGNAAVKRGFEQIRLPEQWLAAVEREGHATRERIELSARERGEEMLMMGLRLAEGVDAGNFAREAGEKLENFLDPDSLRAMIEGGFLVRDERALRATSDGLKRLNAVLAALLARSP